MIFDVDHFKDYNDELGHLAGDKCLVKVGQILLSFVRRPGDLAARLGGDEFALLLGDTDSMGSQMVASTIKNNINTLDMAYGESKQITVSIGVLSLIPLIHQTEALLLEKADKALFRAKLAGRNCVVHEQLNSNK
jgi:diguanylate cyclase (GGDEF)-like protein